MAYVFLCAVYVCAHAFSSLLGALHLISASFSHQQFPIKLNTFVVVTLLVPHLKRNLKSGGEMETTHLIFSDSNTNMRHNPQILIFRDHTQF